MSAIRSLKANVSRSEAEQHFTGGTFSLARMFRDPARSIADLYIPFRLFQVKIVTGAREQSHIFGLEAVQGILDLYEFPALPGAESVMSLETRNVLQTRLSADQAKEEVLAKVRRLVFSRGFFRLRDLRFEAVEVPGEICIPYWVCFRGDDGQVRISVLDAVRRRPEGAKVRRLVEQWLQSK